MKENNKYTAETVSEILKGYKALKRKAMQLEFEIKHYQPKVTEEDIIHSMTFTVMDNGAVPSGQVSDKTARTALNYAEKAESLNIKVKQELEDDLRSIRSEMLRIEYYIGLLESKQSLVIKALYIEGESLNGAAEKLDMSLPTIKRLKKQATAELAAMFNLVIKG